MFTPAEDHPCSYTVWLSVYEELVQAQSLLSTIEEKDEISAVIEAIVAGLHGANLDAKQKPHLALTLPDAVVTTLGQLQSKLEQYGLSKEAFPLFNTFLALIPSWSSWSEFDSDSKKYFLNFIEQQSKKEDLLKLCQTDYTLFKTPVHSVHLSRLLLAVAHGNQSEAERILKKYPHLLLERGNVTDYSGRTFLNITPFEYALWALDVKTMCPMMINCLPKDERGEKIRESLLEQYDNLKKNGIDYILDAKKHRESHYDFKSLTGSLQIYVDNYNTWTKAACENHWCKEVGKAQTFVPAHVAQHYCDPDPEESFYPLPAFKKEKRPQSLEFYSNLTNKTEFWFSEPSDAAGLGVNLGILRDWGKRGGAWGVDGRGGERWLAARDLAALSALCEVRTSHDLVALRKQLKTPLQKPEHSAADQLCQMK